MDAAVKITSELIKKKTITPEDDGAIELLTDILSASNFSCREIHSGNVKNLFARWGPKNPEKTIGFNGHVDVVPPGDTALWEVDPFSGIIKDGEIIGRGAVDMKSAVAAFTAAAVEFVDGNKPNGSIVIAITGDEEGEAINGTKAILQWMLEQDERVPHFIVGEPTSKETLGDMVKIGRRGSLTAFFSSSGTQGHTAYPHLASNPINSMNTLITSILNETLDQGSEHFEPSTLSFTTIDVDNVSNNVIPAKCEATLNIRFNDLHTSESIIAWLNKHIEKTNKKHQAHISMNVKVSGESFINGNSPFVKMVTKEIKDTLNINPILSTSGGTSDARFIKEFSEVLELGLVGKTMHKVNERVKVDEIISLKNLYKSILERYFTEEI